MTDEQEAMEEQTVEQEEPRRRSGPGFVLGVLFGALAGSAAATLFARARRSGTGSRRRPPHYSRKGKKGAQA
jgi:gas vesicle protein